MSYRDLHAPDGPHDPIVVLFHNVDVLIAKVEMLLEVVDKLDSRLHAVERATPWKAPKKPAPPIIRPRPRPH